MMNLMCSLRPRPILVFGFIGLLLTMTASGAAINSASGLARFVKTDVWTWGNNSSSAPSPSCPCDTDPNTVDCPASFLSAASTSVCHDEFIPQGSQGWVHAIFFKARRDQAQFKAVAPVCKDGSFAKKSHSGRWLCQERYGQCWISVDQETGEVIDVQPDDNNHGC